MSSAELFNNINTAPFVSAPRLIIDNWDTHINENAYISAQDLACMLLACDLKSGSSQGRARARCAGTLQMFKLQPW
ncbi:hypothetical protein BDR03DRAFT_2438 [Suillus americanus]|nr:hypothetical protein BDR03DRAFT_2438 [Suillus americanus]